MVKSNVSAGPFSESEFRPQRLSLPCRSSLDRKVLPARSTSRTAKHYRLGRHVGHSETPAVHEGRYRASRPPLADGHVLLRSWLTAPPCDPPCSPPASDR